MGKFCTQCGKPLVPGARFCTYCGAPVGGVVIDAPEGSTVTVSDEAPSGAAGVVIDAPEGSTVTVSDTPPELEDTDISASSQPGEVTFSPTAAQNAFFKMLKKLK